MIFGKFWEYVGYDENGVYYYGIPTFNAACNGKMMNRGRDHFQRNRYNHGLSSSTQFQGFQEHSNQ
jgi:hypothetical protein